MIRSINLILAKKLRIFHLLIFLPFSLKYPINYSCFGCIKYIIEFAIRSGATDKICIFNKTAYYTGQKNEVFCRSSLIYWRNPSLKTSFSVWYWVWNNSKVNGNHYPLTSLKKAVKYLPHDCFSESWISNIFWSYWYNTWFSFYPHSLPI